MRPDAFMYVERKTSSTVVSGESTDAGWDTTHNANLIEILSFSHRIATSQNVSTGGTANVKAGEHEPLKVCKLLDNASPALHAFASASTQGLDVLIVLQHRSGKSDGTADSWKREKYAELHLEHASISRMQLVLDPSVHPLGGVRDGEVLAMGPLEEIEFTYGKITFWYGKPSNKMTWTHTKYA